MKKTRVFLPLAFAAVVLFSLAILILPNWGIVFAQSSPAATITVSDACPLDAAIQSANDNSNAHNSDCVAGGEGTDAIIMPTDGTSTLEDSLEITSAISITGNGHTITADSAFTLFKLNDENASLTLDQLTLSGHGLAADGACSLTEAGAIDARRGRLLVQNSTSTNNTGTLGSSLTVSGAAAVTIENSTFSGNNARCDSIYVAGNSSQPAQLIHVTLVESSLFGIRSGPNGALLIKNSVINARCVNEGGSVALTGTLLHSDNSSCGAPQSSADPRLGSFPALPQAYSLLDDSPAIGLGVAADCLATDQRGMARPMPADSDCDAGAYESARANPLTRSETERDAPDSQKSDPVVKAEATADPPAVAKANAQSKSDTNAQANAQGTSDAIDRANAQGTSDAIDRANAQGTSDAIARANAQGTSDAIARVNAQNTSDAIARANAQSTSGAVARANAQGTSDAIARANAQSTSDAIARANAQGTSDARARANAQSTSDAKDRDKQEETPLAIARVGRVNERSSDDTSKRSVSQRDTNDQATADAITSANAQATSNAIAAANAQATADAIAAANAQATSNAIAAANAQSTANALAAANAQSTADAVAAANARATMDADFANVQATFNARNAAGTAQVINAQATQDAEARALAQRAQSDEQSTSEARRTAIRITKDYQATEYVYDRRTHDAGLRQLANVRGSQTAEAEAAARDRAAGFARSTANAIAVRTSNAAADARSTNAAATQRAAAPQTNAAKTRSFRASESMRNAGGTQTANAVSIILTRVNEDVARTERPKETARAISFMTVEARHRTAQHKARVKETNLANQWRREGQTQEAVRRTNDASNRNIDASQTQRYKVIGTENAKAEARATEITSERATHEAERPTRHAQAAGTRSAINRNLTQFAQTQSG